MTPKKLTILLVGDQLPDGVLAILQDHEVITAIHPYQVQGILAARPVDVLLLQLSVWNNHFFAGRDEWIALPKLVALNSENEHVATGSTVASWSAHYDLVAFYEAVQLAATIWLYESLLVRVDDVCHWLPFSTILLVQKQPLNRVIIHTTEGDFLVNHTLISIKNVLPAKGFERISDTLLIPVGSKRFVSKRGFLFRGGYIQIAKPVITLKKLSNEDLV